MALKGSFHWVAPNGAGKLPQISFRLECNNLLSSEVFNLLLRTGDRDNCWFYKGIKMGARTVYEFNEDTVGWRWTIGIDSASIADDAGKELHKWKVSQFIQTISSCQACGNTHKCRHCNGTGYVSMRRQLTTPHTPNDPFGMSNYYKAPCTQCNGTGVCMECYTPRGSSFGTKPIGQVQPVYVGPYYRIGRGPEIPYVEPNIDFRLKVLDEWKERSDRAQGRVIDAKITGSEPGIRDAESLKRRIDNHIKDLL